MSIDLHDLPAEEAALAAALQNEAACEYVATHLREEDLWSAGSRTVLREIRKLHAAARPVDAVIVRAAACSRADDEEAQRLSDYVGHLGSTFAVAANVAEYVASIVAFSAKRRALVAAETIRGAALSANGNVGDLPAKLEAVTAEAVREMRERGALGRALPGTGITFIDWSTFWDRADRRDQWVYPDVLAKGRGHAIFASRKEGKSLFTLSMAAKLASEAACHVLYLDFEMTEEDVYDRLEDMGYGRNTDLSLFRYALLPSLPPLDTEAGGVALMTAVDRMAAEEPEAHIVVVIDTIGRAVQGEENSADTWRAFYMHTGMRFKQRGVTWLRLDHSGWDGEHARGSSGKGDDVDVVWKLRRTENGIELKRELARMAWVPERVSLLQQEYPLRYLRAADDWPAGTATLANIMDRLELPLDVRVRAARKALTEIGEGRRNDAIMAAVKYRRQAASDQFRYIGERAGERGEQGRGTGPGNGGEQSTLSLGNAPGNAGEQDAAVSGEQTPPLKRGSGSTPVPDPLTRTSGTDDGFDF